MTIKTDQKDACGIAQIIRTGWYRAVHVKTPASQELRMLLSGRKFLVRQLVAIKNEIRGILRGFGLKVGKAGDVGFEARVRKARESVRLLADLEPEVVITGHGRPMRGAEMRAALHRLASEFDRIAVPETGRYLRTPARAEDGSAYCDPGTPN
jgi:transposase